VAWQTPDKILYKSDIFSEFAHNTVRKLYIISYLVTYTNRLHKVVASPPTLQMPTTSAPSTKHNNNNNNNNYLWYHLFVIKVEDNVAERHIGAQRKADVNMVLQRVNTDTHFSLYLLNISLGCNQCAYRGIITFRVPRHNGTSGHPLSTSQVPHNSAKSAND